MIDVMMWWSSNLPKIIPAPWITRQDLTIGPDIFVLFEFLPLLPETLQTPKYFHLAFTIFVPHATSCNDTQHFRSVEEWLHYVMATFVLDHDDAPPLGGESFSESSWMPPVSEPSLSTATLQIPSLQLIRMALQNRPLNPKRKYKGLPLPLFFPGASCSCLGSVFGILKITQSSCFSNLIYLTSLIWRKTSPKLGDIFGWYHIF